MATRRSTRNLEDEPQESTELLSAICLKLDTINESLHLIIKNQQNDQEKKEEKYQAIALSIDTIQQSVSMAVNKSEQNGIKLDVLKQRKRVIRTWKEHLNKRKQLYWQSLNSENTAVFYETWINKDIKVIPKKYLMKDIPNENADERNIRKQSVINQFQAEINLLKIRAERHTVNYKKVDQDMLSVLESHFSGDVLAEMKRLWTEETETEETKSQLKWQTKQKWLEGYEENFANEDFVRPVNDEETKKAFKDRRDSHHKHQTNVNHHQQTRVTPRATTLPRTQPAKQTYENNQPRSNNRTKPDTRNLQFRHDQTVHNKQQRPIQTRFNTGEQPRRNAENTRDKPTYASIVRSSNDDLPRIANNSHLNRNENHFFEAAYTRKYPPNLTQQSMFPPRQHRR